MYQVPVFFKYYHYSSSTHVLHRPQKKNCRFLEQIHDWKHFYLYTFFSRIIRPFRNSAITPATPSIPNPTNLQWSLWCSHYSVAKPQQFSCPLRALLRNAIMSPWKCGAEGSDLILPLLWTYAQTCWSVAWAIVTLDLHQDLSRKRPIARNEVHHSVCCLLDVPHPARLSRLCRGRPRPCSRRLPATGAVFVFTSKYIFRSLVSICTYRYLLGTW